MWVSTIRGSAAKKGRGPGQVVGSLTCVGTTGVGLSGLMDTRHEANHSRGGFEVETLKGFALLPGEDGLRTFVRAVREQAGRLDQTGPVACFYAALRYWNLDVVGAFAEAFERPWWDMPWAQDDSWPDQPRVVRDARRVVPDEADAITAAAPAWAVPGRRWTRA